MIINRRWEHMGKQRYYQVLLAQDLFNEWVVTRVWGGINQATGRIIRLPCTYNEGIALVDKISKTRISRGYVLSYDRVVEKR